jgi:hypothetical protein
MGMGMGMAPQPPDQRERAPVRYMDSVPHHHAHARGGEGDSVGFSKLAKAAAVGKPSVLMLVEESHANVRHSFPHASMQQASMPVQNRLQVVPQAALWGPDDRKCMRVCV